MACQPLVIYSPPFAASMGLKLPSNTPCNCSADFPHSPSFAITACNGLYRFELHSSLSHSGAGSSKGERLQYSSHQAFL